MPTFGSFAGTSSLFSSNRFIAAPAPKAPAPTRTAVPRAPTIQPTAPTITAPTTAVFAPRIVTTTTTTGDSFVSSAVNPVSSAPPATGSSTGNQTGSTGGGDTSRLLDLIGAAFQPQDIGQTYGPQSVASSALPNGTSGGTNPMAIVILAIVAIAGVYWYSHHKSKRAA